ncbi:hypothetical protein FQA39_LY12050 [Lamprigera yunnana]|nr:hypothetical protein FQA39_LY12050 [Lamprigera yunnana]
MVVTSEQDAFVVMAHFCSGTRNPDGTWSYSLQSCIEQFSEDFPDFNIEYNVFKKHRLCLIKQYENKHCICKGRSIVLAEEVVNDIQQIDQSPKKSIPHLSAQTVLPIGTCYKALKKMLHMHPYKISSIQLNAPWS